MLRALSAELQDLQTKRINVQRKTINNWRNNKSMPRSVNDRQFQLALAALEVNEKELSALMRFLESPSEKEDGNDKEQIAASTTQQKWIVVTICGFLGAIIISLLIQLLPNNTQNSYLTEIPQSELPLSDEGYVFPKSDTERITNVQLEKLSGWALYVARNEIFARRGWEFTRASSICLQNHFNKLSKLVGKPNGWYQPSPQRNEPSNLESGNVETIRRYECSVRGGQFKCNGRLN